MKVIRLYGRLAKFLGQRKFEADVANAAEAVRFLLANFPHLEGHMIEQRYKVQVGKREVGEDELQLPSSERETIKFIPVVAGAGAVGRIIAGVALVAAAFFTGGATIGLLGLAAPIAVSSVLLGVGASLILGGVAQLLTPTPNVPTGSNSDDDPRRSYSFSGIQNTSRQGVPVPICYGEVLLGSAVISAGVDIDQVVV